MIHEPLWRRNALNSHVKRKGSEPSTSRANVDRHREVESGSNDDVPSHNSVQGTDKIHGGFDESTKVLKLLLSRTSGRCSVTFHKRARLVQKDKYRPLRSHSCEPAS